MINLVSVGLLVMVEMDSLDPLKYFSFTKTRQRNRFLICSIRAHVILYPIS